MKTLTQSQFKNAFLPALICILLFSICKPSFALKNNNSSTGNKQNPVVPSPLLAGCNPGAAMTDLNINNVRARMCTGGDMWWDYSLQVGQYEVPYNPHE